MSAEDNRRTIEEFYAAGGPAGEREAMTRFFGPSYLSHTGPEGVERGMAQHDALRAFLDRTFSDVSYELLRLVADDEFAAAHTLFRATHTGDGLGVRPTGRQVEAEQMHFVRFEDGKIVEHWGVRDDAGLMRQVT